MNLYDPNQPGPYPSPRYIPPAKKKMPLWAKVVVWLGAVPALMIGGCTAFVAAGGASELAGSRPDPAPVIGSTYDPGINTPEARRSTRKPAEESLSLTPQDGTLLVGKDVKAGTYQTRVPGGIVPSCYWARLRDLDGSDTSIIDNGIKATAGALMTVTIKRSDYAVEINCNGAVWERVK